MPRLTFIMLALAAAPSAAVAQTGNAPALLLGSWQLDSLRVVPLATELSDSARASLERYTRVLAGVNDSFRSGATRIVTEYGLEGRFIHSVFQGSAAAPVHQESGQWGWLASGTISCPREPGPGHCPHHGAQIIVVNARQLVLELDLSGAATGIRETFWLTRVP